MLALNMQSVGLADGRIVKVSEYPDGSIRLKVSGRTDLRYALTECFLPGAGHEAIIKLILLPGAMGKRPIDEIPGARPSAWIPPWEEKESDG